MPELAKVLTAEDLQRSSRTTQMDLSQYIDLIENVRSQSGVGADVELQEGENRRTEKRRLSMAAEQLGLTLTWRKSGDGVLRFVLSEPGGTVPGGRPRRTEPQQTETRRGRRRS